MALEPALPQSESLSKPGNLEFSAGGIGETINPATRDSLLAAVKGERKVFLSQNPPEDQKPQPISPGQKENAVDQATSDLLEHGVDSVFALSGGANDRSRDISATILGETIANLSSVPDWTKLTAESVQQKITEAIAAANAKAIADHPQGDEDNNGARFAMAMTINGETYCARSGMAGVNFYNEKTREYRYAFTDLPFNHFELLGKEQHPTIVVTPPIRLENDTKIVLGQGWYMRGRAHEHQQILAQKQPLSDTRKALINSTQYDDIKDTATLVVARVHVPQEPGRVEKAVGALKATAKQKGAEIQQGVAGSLTALETRAKAAGDTFGRIGERIGQRLKEAGNSAGAMWTKALGEVRSTSRKMSVKERLDGIRNGKWLEGVTKRLAAMRAEWNKRMGKPELGGATVPPEMLSPEAPTSRQKKIIEFSKNIVGAVGIGVATGIAKNYALILTGGAGAVVAGGAAAALSGARGVSEMRGRGLASMMAEDVSFKKSKKTGWRGALENVGNVLGVFGRGYEVQTGQFMVRAFSVERGAENQRVRSMLNEIVDNPDLTNTIKDQLLEGLGAASPEDRLFRSNLVAIARQLGRDREVGYFRELDYLKSKGPESTYNPQGATDKLDTLYRELRSLSRHAIRQLEQSELVSDKTLARELTQVLSESRRSRLNRFGLEAAYVTGRSLTAAAKAIDVFSIFSWGFGPKEAAVEQPAEAPTPLTPEQRAEMNQPDVLQQVRDQPIPPPTQPTAPTVEAEVPRYARITVNRTFGHSVVEFMKSQGVTDPHLWRDTNVISGLAAQANYDNADLWNRGLAMATAAKNAPVLATLQEFVTSGGLDKGKIDTLVQLAQSGDAAQKADAVIKLKQLWHYMPKGAVFDLPLSLIGK